MSMTTFVASLSQPLAQILADRELPALTDGRILLGKEYVVQHSSPPRVVMVPLNSEFGPKLPGSDPQQTGQFRSPSGYTQGQLNQLQNRQIWTNHQGFRVHVWGDAPDKDHEKAFDYTELLRDAFIDVLQAKLPGQYTLLRGQWVDQVEGNLVIEGHEYMLEMHCMIPISDTPAIFVPPGTTVNQPFPTYSEEPS